MFAHIEARAAITAVFIVTAIMLSSAGTGLCQAGPNGSLAYSIQPTAGLGVAQLSAIPQNLPTPLPDVFDLRDEGRAAPARSDDSCASCWADAATYVMESLLMSWEEVDLSDAHMQLVQLQTCQAGGTADSAMNYLVSWNGPIAESDYNQLVLKQGMKAQARAHVQQVRYLPLRKGPLDNLGIKSAIYHYGPVYAGVGWRGITNPTYNSYYWPHNGAAHAVALVGWDDHFPKHQFTYTSQGTTYTPPGDGAFIAKNNDGNFYFLSYYDGTVGYDTVATFAVEPVSNHQHIYQHDPYGTKNWIGPHKIPGNSGDFVSAIFGANVFTALEAGVLSTIGFFVKPYKLPSGEQAVFEVAIHLDPDSDPVNSAGAALSFTTRVSLGGYHSIALPTEIPLSANQRFSVVLRGHNTMGTHNAIYLPVERMPNNEPFEVSPGESFISKDGLSWFDLTDVPDTNSETGAMEYVYGNLGIKAYTKVPGTAPTIIVSKKNNTLLKAETVELSNDSDHPVKLRPLFRDQAGTTERTATQFMVGAGRSASLRQGWLEIGPRTTAEVLLPAGGVTTPTNQEIKIELLDNLGRITLLKPWRPVYTLGTAPVLESTSPQPNSTVAAENPQITARFYGKIKPGPGLAQITLNALDETRQVYASVQGDTLSIFPVGPLGATELGGKQWTVTIPADAVTDLFGNPMEQPYTWSFWVMGVN